MGKWEEKKTNFRKEMGGRIDREENKEKES